MSETRTEKEIIAEAYSDEAAKTWRAPVQGYPQGIPWPVHLEAYDAYAARWSRQPALLDLKGRNCRGGFHVDELDMLIPGWRDRVTYVAKLESRISQLEAQLRSQETGGWQLISTMPNEDGLMVEVKNVGIERWNAARFLRHYEEDNWIRWSWREAK